MPPDAPRLLAAVADALNACERAGIAVQLEHGAVLTDHGYVLPLGDPGIGCLWAARMKTPRTGQITEPAPARTEIAE